MTRYKPYQPKTGQRCGCKPGIVRDNCPECEGTGWRIDFAAIRAKPKMIPGQSPYTGRELELLYKLISDAADGDPGEDKEGGQ